MLLCLLVFVFTSIYTHAFISRFNRQRERAVKQLPVYFKARVLENNGDSFVIDTAAGKFRFKFSDYQLFLRNIALLEKKNGGSKSSKNSDAGDAGSIANISKYRVVTLKRFGRVYQTTGVSYAAKGISGTVYGKIIWKEEKTDKKILKLSEGKVKKTARDFLAGIHHGINEGFERYLTRETIPLCLGILTGNSSLLPPTKKIEFSRCGAMHLLAVSGLHVGILTVILAFVLGLFRINICLKRILVFLGVSMFVLFTGVSASSARAWLMIALFIITGAFYRPNLLKDILHASYLFFIILNPLSIYILSFQLSFTCLFSIAYLLPLLENLELFTGGYFAKSVSLLFSIQVAVAPILLANFGETPFIGSFANLIIVPMAAPLLSLTLLLALISSFSFLYPLSELISAVLVLMVKFVYRVVSVFAALPLAYIGSYEKGLAALCLTVVAVFMAYLLGKKRNLKISGVIFFLVAVVFFSTWLYEKPGRRSEFVCLDVGEGNSNLLISRNSAILIDSGPVDSKVINSLLDRNVRFLDVLAISHYHLDHSGSLPEILLDNGIKVKTLLLPKPVSSPEKRLFNEAKKLAEVINIAEIRSVSVGSWKIRTLTPDISDVWGSEKNELCSAFLCTYNGIKILYLADMPAEVQKRMLGNLTADYIVVSHHGSKDGFYRRLYRKAVKAAFVSYGKNIYGHPSGEVINGLKNMGVEVYTTVERGDITLTLNNL